MLVEGSAAGSTPSAEVLGGEALQGVGYASPGT